MRTFTIAAAVLAPLALLACSRTLESKALQSAPAGTTSERASADKTAAPPRDDAPVGSNGLVADDRSSPAPVALAAPEAPPSVAAAAPRRARPTSASAPAPVAPPAPPSGHGAVAESSVSAGAGAPLPKPSAPPSAGFKDLSEAPPSMAMARAASGPGWSPAFSAPSIAAGEWNDNANYHEFQKWLATETSLPFTHVDVSHRRFLVVRDEDGRPVPGCPVTVTDAQQRQVTLTTGPSGRALFFPRAEGVGSGFTTATANCNGAHLSRPISLDAADGVVDLRLPVTRALPAQRTIDVAFILDTTGSMSEEIASVKNTIAKVAAGLGDNGNSNVSVRIGLVEFKDRGDVFVTRVHPFSTDVTGFSRGVAGISAGGGGDTPESVNEGIHVALTGLDWSPTSLGRFAFLVGDAPPHLDYAQDFSYANDMKTAAHNGIQIFTIAASGMDPVGQVIWRQIAEYTNASNMFVLRGGAGPQSTGGGDPRSSCGGTHQNYSSGNLDALILGKIRGELRAVDGDAMRIAGLNEDEDAKPCDQRVVWQQ